MQIGELARECGTSTRTLRYYEQHGLLQSERDTNGYRRYGTDAVLTVRQIRALLRAGFSTAAIAELLPCARGEEPLLDHCPKTVALVRETLDRIEAELSTLEGKHACMSTLLPRTGRRAG
ncbi:MerR family transcriptional regulator [Flexivirga meconopsidis]|uniref:MerR family transcriptional regulator n=1 Tax=Flexivirga meconopsidis TaxID=2977121 RepID=UPI00223F20A5|nr:MerR family transcriptional regulator [Flexivirga meconopsidis]